jgi:hypothetical protein
VIEMIFLKKIKKQKLKQFCFGPKQKIFLKTFIKQFMKLKDEITRSRNARSIEIAGIIILIIISNHEDKINLLL